VFSRTVISTPSAPRAMRACPWPPWPRPSNPPPGCIHYSDRGLQYSSRRYREQLADAGLLGSMSRASNPYGNAPVESFMKTFKHEEIDPRGYRRTADVIAHLRHFLGHIYHNQRQHSALKAREPNAFEAAHALPFSYGQIATI
jgi:putative transposase